MKTNFLGKVISKPYSLATPVIYIYIFNLICKLKIVFPPFLSCVCFFPCAVHRIFQGEYRALICAGILIGNLIPDDRCGRDVEICSFNVRLK